MALWLDDFMAIIVLTTGVFDVLHDEHVNFLRKAKELGDMLIVGIESDVRVRKIKGKTRPVNGQDSRIKNLEKLGFIDRLFILPEEFDTRASRERLIAEIRPDYFAVSSHSPFIDNKRQIVEKYGGKLVVVHEHNPAISSSVLIKNSSGV